MQISKANGLWAFACFHKKEREAKPSLGETFMSSRMVFSVLLDYHYALIPIGFPREATSRNRGRREADTNRI